MSGKAEVPTPVSIAGIGISNSGLKRGKRRIISNEVFPRVTCVAFVSFVFVSFIPPFTPTKSKMAKLPVSQHYLYLRHLHLPSLNGPSMWLHFGPPSLIAG